MQRTAVISDHTSNVVSAVGCFTSELHAVEINHEMAEETLQNSAISRLSPPTAACAKDGNKQQNGKVWALLECNLIVQESVAINSN